MASEHTHRPKRYGTRLTLPQREVERAVRERVRGEIRRRGLGPDDSQHISALIFDEIDAYQRRAASTNIVPLDEPEATAQRLYDTLLGMGPLQPLLDDPAVEEIEVNAPNRIFVRLRDQTQMRIGELSFDSDDEVVTLIKRLVGPMGARFDESAPMVDAVLPNGSRLNAVMPPVAVDHTLLTIRKFLLHTYSLEQLVENGTLSADAADFLSAAVQAGVNILVSGQTGSGKTTVLNALASSMDATSERLVTVEDIPELALTIPNCARLQVRSRNMEGSGQVTIRELVRNALRMRPTRIIVGEVRGGEALDMLQAMSTGHDGSLTTLHANSPREALDRLVTMAMMAEERPPREALLEMVSNTIQVVVQLRIDARSGMRQVTHVFELAPLADGHLTGNDLWKLDKQGRLVWTGIPPRCLDKIGLQGVAYSLPTLVGNSAGGADR